jgi:hypothetical protein
MRDYEWLKGNTHRKQPAHIRAGTSMTFRVNALKREYINKKLHTSGDSVAALINRPLDWQFAEPSTGV